jgi:molybdenum cofactor cytidylyltransferase
VLLLITGIILASGFSTRVNREKLILNVGGVPIIESVIRAVKFSHIDEVLIIYQNDKIKEIAEKYSIKTVYNERANEGQSAAIKTGIQSAHPDTDGFMFLVGDQPYLNSNTINKLIDTFKREKQTIVVPVYAGKRRNPVIFPSKLREDLLNITGDCGGRVIIDRMTDSVKLVNINKSIVGIDINTEDEYEKYKNAK